MSEERYEALNLILKARSDGEAWFDVIVDMISEGCEGGGGDCILAAGEDSDCDDHDHEEILPCTCGLEFCSGSSGTLDQCYRYQGIAEDLVGPVDKSDLELLLDYVQTTGNTQPKNIVEIVNKLRKECIWWDMGIEKEE